MPKIRTLACVAAAAALAACSDRTPSAPVAGATSDPLVQKLVSEGFRPDMIEDHGDFFVVEGDISISKASLRSAAPAPGGPRMQYLFGSAKQVSSSFSVHNIKVDLSGISSNAAWTSAVRDAMYYWNNVSGSYVQFYEATPANIKFILDSGLGSAVIGRGDAPSGGNPGDTVRVNPSFVYDTTYAAKVFAAVHELGHTLGFRHTNWNQVDCLPTSCNNNPGTDGAVHISGTPTSGNDNSSVMNGGTAGTHWSGFSTWDRYAIAAVFPLPAPSLSVTYPSNVPHLSWTAMDGAQSYTVNLVYHHVYDSPMDNIYEDTETPNWLGDTYDNSFVDTSNSWTGNSGCTLHMDSYTTEWDEYWYEVIVHYANGDRSARAAAEIETCPY